MCLFVFLAQNHMHPHNTPIEDYHSQWRIHESDKIKFIFNFFINTSISRFYLPDTPDKKSEYDVTLSLIHAIAKNKQISIGRGPARRII